ncbi:MAG: cyclic nucleotide-binding domain-containing protein [Archangium sp.]|nr:cyclic nucleotide-binding domain-containing protein [Archangium sp.]
MTTELRDDASGALRALTVFRDVDPALLEKLSTTLTPRQLAAGEALIRQGDHGDAMFIVRTGTLRVLVRGDDGREREVAVLGPGAHLGEIQLLTAGPRTASVLAATEAEVLQLSRSALDALGDGGSALTDALAASVHARLQADEIASVLRSIVGPVEQAVIDAFQKVVKWVYLQRGEALFRQGDPGDAWFIITGGRLEIEITNPQGESQVIGQLGRGDSLGEIALLTGEPRSATPYAIRDSRIARIDKADFDAIMLAHPAVLMSVSRTLSRTLVARTASGPRKRQKLRLSITVVNGTPGAPRAWVTQRLLKALELTGSVLHVSSERLAALGVVQNASALSEEHPAWRRFASWIEQQEATHDFVVFEADDTANAWTKRALRASDHVLVVSNATGDVSLSAVERELFDRGREKRLGARTSLVLVHGPDVRIPSRTAAWLDARPFVQRHHHVRQGRDGDVDRIARLISGRGIGLTLGGGGARGFAHLGVIRAMNELGLPIDFIGGTSMGSIMAGQYAMGISLEEAFELNGRIAAAQPFREFTLPFVAVLRSRRIDNSALMSFADVCIEDLWTPYFCISANLTRAEMIVHERGPVWKATRASGSLPGIAVPVIEGNNLLVDGGVINNLPGDIMRKRCNGAVIAVDVSPEEDVSMTHAEFPSPWTMLWNRLWPRRQRIAVPSINDILMRTLMLGSASRTHQVRREVDLYLRPPIDRFGMLEFDGMRDIAKVGYDYALQHLPKWAESWQPKR